MNSTHKLQTIFRECFNDPALAIAPETSPRTLPDWDSVAQVHLVLAIEEAFGFRFTTDEVARVQCVGDFLSVIEAHLR